MSIVKHKIETELEMLVIDEINTDTLIEIIEWANANRTQHEFISEVSYRTSTNTIIIDINSGGYASPRQLDKGDCIFIHGASVKVYKRADLEEFFKREYSKQIAN